MLKLSPLCLHRFPITLEWAGQSVHETVYWFQHEPNPEANSNVYDVATRLVQKHFPGEFGSERLVQKVVDIILRRTASKDGENKGEDCMGTHQQLSKHIFISLILTISLPRVINVKIPL